MFKAEATPEGRARSARNGEEHLQHFSGMRQYSALDSRQRMERRGAGGTHLI